MLTVALPNNGAVQIARSIARRQPRPLVARHAPAAHRARGHARRRVARVAHRPPHRAADRRAHAHRDLRGRDAGSRQSDHRQPSRRDRPARVELQQHARRVAHVARAATTPRHGRESRAAHTAHRAADQHRPPAARPDFDEAQRDELLGETDVELRELTDLLSELVELATDTRTEEPVQNIDLARARRPRRGAPTAAQWTRDLDAGDRPGERRRAGDAARTRGRRTSSTTR